MKKFLMLRLASPNNQWGYNVRLIALGAFIAPPASKPRLIEVEFYLLTIKSGISIAIDTLHSIPLARKSEVFCCASVISACSKAR